MSTNEARLACQLRLGREVQERVLRLKITRHYDPKATNRIERTALESSERPAFGQRLRSIPAKIVQSIQETESR